MQTRHCIAIFGSVALLAGCVSPTSTDSKQSASAEVIESPVILTQADGTTESAGVGKFNKKAIEGLRKIKVSMAQFDEHGNLVAFKPALPPADGVTPPPEGAEFESATFKDGRLVSWK